jgi:uncharacterized protein with von Willebrand factor type A (vWA) domain
VTIKILAERLSVLDLPVMETLPKALVLLCAETSVLVTATQTLVLDTCPRLRDNPAPLKENVEMVSTALKTLLLANPIYLKSLATAMMTALKPILITLDVIVLEENLCALHLLLLAILKH